MSSPKDLLITALLAALLSAAVPCALHEACP